LPFQVLWALPMVNTNFCLWLTGLPGSGKTTITMELEKLLTREGVSIVILTMDRLRSFLTPKPKHSEEERETVYRALVLIAQFIVEYSSRSVVIDATGNRRHFRELARERIREFGEVYIKCAIEVSRARETTRVESHVEKNLYRKAQNDQLQGALPGVTAPYEEPIDPEIEVSSDALTPLESAQEIMGYVRSKWLT
jgi:adenylylsulfate kinase